jgi:hypothetical protein
MDEAMTEWYKQSVVSEDFDFDGPIDLFHEYDIFLDANVANANMDDAFINDENAGG